MTAVVKEIPDDLVEQLVTDMNNMLQQVGPVLVARNSVWNSLNSYPKVLAGEVVINFYEVRERVEQELVKRIEPSEPFTPVLSAISNLEHALDNLQAELETDLAGVNYEQYHYGLEITRSILTSENAALLNSAADALDTDAIVLEFAHKYQL